MKNHYFKIIKTQFMTYMSNLDQQQQTFLSEPRKLMALNV